MSSVSSIFYIVSKISKRNCGKQTFQQLAEKLFASGRYKTKKQAYAKARVVLLTKDVNYIDMLLHYHKLIAAGYLVEEAGLLDVGVETLMNGLKTIACLSKIQNGEKQ